MDSPARPSKDKIFLFLSIVISLVLLLPTLIVPLNADNEIFQSMACDLIRFHQLPYIGSWDHNFPGNVYLHWLAIVLFGNSAFGFRLFDLLVHTTMGAMYYLLLRRWLSPTSGFLSVVLYVGFYLGNIASIGGERETFAMAFLLTGTLLLLKVSSLATPNTYYRSVLYIAGISFGLTVTLRPTNILFVLCALLYIWTTRNNFYSIAFIVGVITPLIAMILPYLFIRGGIDQAFFSTVRYNLEVYGSRRKPWKVLIHQILALKFFFVPAIAGIGFIFQHKSRKVGARDTNVSATAFLSKSEQLLFGGYMTSGILTLILIGKYWTYSFEPIIMVSIPFSAIGLEYVATMMGRTLKYALAIVLILFFFVRVATFPIHLVASIIHPEQRLEIEAGFSSENDDSISAYIERAPFGERFEVASIHAGVRWRVQRRSASRFTTFNAVTLSTPRGEHPDFQQAWQREFIDSLHSARPFYIVLSHFAPVELSAPVESIHTIPGFDSEILPHYQLDTILGNYSILRRKD
jgi:hypothetical protein